mgnify:CR=1 FL=1
MINKELKTIIISGGLGLLGREFAKTLSRGYNVILLDTPDKVDSYYEGEETHYFYTFSCDITDESQIKQIIEYINEKWGHIDIAVNCAAINPIPKKNEDNSFENYSLDKWKKTLDVNLTGAFLFSRECITYMLKNKNDGFKGTIVNVTSQLGFVSPNQNIYDNKYIKPADYSVAASGIISLTRYLACYYGGIIKVNCLIPSMVENGQSKEFVKNAEKLIPMGRMSQKTEFNSAIKFLCSEETSYMTGQVLICDGGYTSW